MIARAPEHLGIASLLDGRKAVVVGVGNRMRGDDGIGSRLAGRLIDRGYAGVVDAETVPENYLGTLLDSAPDVVLFVDAADFGGTPGECCIAPASGLAGCGVGTHVASLALLDIVLRSRGVDCWLLGIQPFDTGFGAEVSPAVEKTARVVEASLVAALPEEVGHA